ncbi:MAG TPA: CPCC family cysteine-rich protein [Candidatus Dormibacteraeota bacterium]|nr:CPCC family cysteine-rich protein [Candidatus Dormibacteraeota bacterium]
MFKSISKPTERVKTYRCPCCAFKTLFGRGGFEICPVCWWEDDGQDDHDAEQVRGGPNGALSLTEARKNFATYGASDPQFASRVREPLHDEKPAEDVTHHG